MGDRRVPPVAVRRAVAPVRRTRPSRVADSSQSQSAAARAQSTREQDRLAQWQNRQDRVVLPVPEIVTHAFRADDHVAMTENNTLWLTGAA